MAAHVEEGKFVEMEMLMQGSYNFEAEVRIALNPNRWVESWISKPITESCDERERVQVDRYVMRDFVVGDQVDV